MTDKQKVLVILNQDNRLSQHFSSLQERLNYRDCGFSVKRLDLTPVQPQIIKQIEQHLTQRGYDLVLTPLEMDLVKVIRQHYEGKIVGYTYSSQVPEEDVHDDVLSFALLRDFSDSLISRIQKYLKSSRS